VLANLVQGYWLLPPTSTTEIYQEANNLNGHQRKV